MRIANLSGRLVIIAGDRALDVERASSGAFPADPQGVYSRWADFIEWASAQDATAGEPYATADLNAAVPRPSQVFAIGLNYASHAGESGFEVPKDPVVFTKFVSSFAGPNTDVVLTGDTVDWEAELVVVIGKGGTDIPDDQAWDRIAGLSVGQDLSDRTVQFWGHPPQFSLGKSRAGFSPVGPNVVTLDEVDVAADRNDLSVRCTVTHADGATEVLQDGRTRDLIFSIPTLVARLSAVLELLPGDVIFTGTPAGVGHGRTPKMYLQPGDVLTTEIEAVGTLVQRFISPA
jgi:2-keto-4-pentenoate hydratase/2-oxohepta-3-ene-1,7-dioic acid hydratase in catechol pathway